MHACERRRFAAAAVSSWPICSSRISPSRRRSGTEGSPSTCGHLVNHQSCEGAGHDARFRVITGLGQEAYHDSVCDELGLPSSETAVMGTAANMNYVADRDRSGRRRRDHGGRDGRRADQRGLRGRSGELARDAEGIAKVAAVAGTINTMLAASAGR